MARFRRGQRVRYLNDKAKPLGVVADEDGRQFSVRFDDDEVLTFENDPHVEAPLERVEWQEGDTVVVRSTQATAKVVRVAGNEDLRIYKVIKGDGQSVSVPEEDLSESPDASDPLTNLKRGRLDSMDEFELASLARRLHHAYHYRELSSLSSARIDIQPHQVAVLHRVINTYPHRFILADEVGLGKTIEAGLILKEMKARGMVRRVLILTPPGLALQWLAEMHHKFNEPFKYFSSRRLRDEQSETPDVNVWTKYDQVIAPITALTMIHNKTLREDRWDDVSEAGWDLVIVDEAHHMRRHYKGAEEAGQTTRPYQLGERLREHARFTLFLTATPLQLHSYELYSLVELLDPGRFADYDDFEEKRQEITIINRAVQALEPGRPLEPEHAEELAEELADVLGEDAPSTEELADPEHHPALIDRLEQSHHLSGIMIRNRKARIGGFKKRRPKNHFIDMTAAEAAIYNDITEWLRLRNETVGQENRAIGFMLVTFQRLLASSPRALAAAFSKRIKKLEDPNYIADLHERLQKKALKRAGKNVDPEALAAALAGADTDSDDEDSASGDAFAGWGVYAPSVDELAVQIREEIEALREFLTRIRRLRRDSKRSTLLDVLKAIHERGLDEKVVVFTQYYETQDHICDGAEELYREQGIDEGAVLKFNGKLSTEDKNRVVNKFRNDPQARLLVLTESGGEGRNLQFSHIIVNYDLPWNPMKVEQRIGRLDRLTQEHDVEIHNLALKKTVEEDILQILHYRIRLFEETVGGLDPILEKIESEIGRATMDPERFRDLEVAVQDDVAKAREAEVKLADVVLDRRSFRRDTIEGILHGRAELDRKDLERFFKRFCRKHNVRCNKVEAGVLRVQTGLYTKARSFSADNRTYYLTFDPDLARTRDDVELCGFGHKLFDAAIAEALEDRGYGASVRVVHDDVDQPEAGALFVYELSMGGLRPQRTLLPYYVSSAQNPCLELGHSVLCASPQGIPVGVGKEQILAQVEPHLDPWADAAEDAANEAMLQHRTERLAEQDRLFEAERTHIEKYFEHKIRELKRGLRHAASTRDKIHAYAEDDPRRRILPTWDKRVQTSEDALVQAENERLRRLSELDGKRNTEVNSVAVQVSVVLRMPRT